MHAREMRFMHVNAIRQNYWISHTFHYYALIIIKDYHGVFDEN